MHIVLNTKFFAELDLDRLGAAARTWGYDGLDICARPGHPVTLENVDQTLPAAHRRLQEEGLVCPLVTAPVDFNDPAAPEAERLYAACAAAGIARIKLGYWRYWEGEDYWEVLERAREALAGFCRLSEQYGVQSCHHTHSGSCIGSNCAGTMHLVRGFEPQQVGVYPDFGHIAFDGEDLAMGLAMVRDYLSIVGIKDGCHVPQAEGQEPARVPMFVKLGVGSVDWRRVLTLLKNMGFAGDLAVHTEYQFDEAIIRQVGYAEEKPADLEEFVRQDAAYLRGLMGEVGIS